MSRTHWMALWVGLAVLGAPAARADVWDVQTENDNTAAGTENELVHGADQLHDLATLPGPVADDDWYRISQKPFSSYEIVADATSGDIGPNLLLDRTDGAGAPLQSSVAVGIGYTRSLRWANDTAAEVNDERIRVMSNGCTTDCGADDVYRIRATETTYWIPRFNNAGTQITVLILQNPTNQPIAGEAYFRNTAGLLVGIHAFSLDPHATLVLNTGAIASGLSGAITIAHDGRYGDLLGKTVALEPSTGFSFDSPLVPRIR